MENFLKDNAVADALGIHRVSLWRWVKEGRFPQPVKLTSGSTRWRESDVLKWQKEVLSGVIK